MAYAPFTWKDGQQGGTPLTADRLNLIEQGIFDAALDADSANAALAGKASTTQGLPAGGTAGQLLVKNSSTDYAAGWQNPSTTVPAHTHPESQIDGLTNDLAALRTTLFGGPTRSQAPAAYAYLTVDAPYLASRNYIFTTGWAKFTDPDNMVFLAPSQSVPTTITAPVDGMYLVEFHTTSTAVSDALYLRVLLNAPDMLDASVSGRTIINATGFGAAEATHAHLIRTYGLLAGDVLSFSFYGRNPGTLKPAWFGGARQTFIGLRYLGPVQRSA